MDFFAIQDQARKKTSLLVLLFIVAVIVLTAGIYFAVTGIWYIAIQEDMEAPKAIKLWDVNRAIGSSACTLLIVLSGSIYQILQLSRGGGTYVAEMMGGRLIPPNSGEPGERRLLNVVEEMAIASGVPLPPVYVLDDQVSINAFAAGYNPSDAVISVSRGCLEKLTRSELQGVVAHEYSHILNGDMRLNIRLMGVLHGILLIALMGKMLIDVIGHSGRARYRTRTRGGKGAALIFMTGVALYVIGWTGVFFGKLIKNAISRQREFLADAAAVQFTRDDAGLTGALKKIGGYPTGSRVLHPRVEQTSHMFFGDAIPIRLGGLMSTHPPLMKRIRKIDPTFQGPFPELENVSRAPESASGFAGASADVAAPATAATGVRVVKPGRTAKRRMRPATVVKSIGAPIQEHLERARELLHDLPDDLQEKARDPYGARALIYALLLNHDEDIRNRQLERLQQAADPAVYEETQKLKDPVKELPREVRLPLCDLSIAALKQMSEKQYEAFKENVDHLIAADAQMDLFEFALTHSLTHNLNAAFGRPEVRRTQIYSMKGVEAEASCVLSVLARFGHAEEEQARQAFYAAVNQLASLNASLKFLPDEDCTLGAFSEALDRLAVTSIKVRKWIVAACVQSLAFDGRINPDEAELFRAVSYALDCPVPLLT